MAVQGLGKGHREEGGTEIEPIWITSPQITVTAAIPGCGDSPEFNGDQTSNR